MSVSPASLAAVLRRLVAVVACALVLAACRIDVSVDMTIGADGTGDVVVTAVADAEVVDGAPGLAEDLRFDDAIAAGWTVEGPSPAADGGLTVTLRHPIASAEEATNVMASLGPPFVDVRLDRTTAGDETTVTLSGQLLLANGFDSFADSDLLASAGGTPYADELAATTPEESMSVVLWADLPGRVESTTGSSDEGGLQWQAPLDGSSTDLATVSVQEPARGGSWAGPLSVLALVLLVAWLVAVALFVVYVVRARQRRSSQRA